MLSWNEREILPESALIDSHKVYKFTVAEMVVPLPKLKYIFQFFDLLKIEVKVDSDQSFIERFFKTYKEIKEMKNPP